MTGVCREPRCTLCGAEHTDEKVCKSLVCGHSLCEQCCGAAIRKYTAAQGALAVPVECPSCLRVTAVRLATGLAGLPNAGAEQTAPVMLAQLHAQMQTPGGVAAEHRGGCWEMLLSALSAVAGNSDAQPPHQTALLLGLLSQAVAQWGAEDFTAEQLNVLREALRKFQCHAHALVSLLAGNVVEVIWGE
eukprot:TRINITY_DN43422_c0_g1_i1.p1 TRINITY_DN43422_c0_g1~~TRINITY_DN43422_c0_g1_i1.p1  ORF type:complete len:213 (+),score=53.69 TRINITY_DN43422_c0_g1_i1:73-639(+)